MSADNGLSQSTAQNLMTSPSKTYLWQTGDGDYDIPDSFMMTMMETVADGNVSLEAFDDTPGTGRTVFRYKGVQYAGRVKKILAATAVNVLLWGPAINASNFGDLKADPS